MQWCFFFFVLFFPVWEITGLNSHKKKKKKATNNVRDDTWYLNKTLFPSTANIFQAGFKAKLQNKWVAGLLLPHAK